MAYQKKPKKRKSSCVNLQVFNWNPQKRRAARLLSEGTKTIDEVAAELKVSDRTIYSWKPYPDFLKEVDRLTYLLENATRAGIVRKALMALDIKESYISEDRSTYLDYLDFIIKIIPQDIKEDDDKMKALTDAILNSAKMIGK